MASPWLHISYSWSIRAHLYLVHCCHALVIVLTKMAASSKISASLLQILILWVSLASSDEDTSGGWQPASVEESMKYYTNICNIAKIPISEMTSERFEKEYRNTPFILTFPNGKKDWVQSDFWTVNNLSASYDQWQFTAGKSIDIVYSGGKGDTRTTFKEFVEEMRTKKVHGGDLTWVIVLDMKAMLWRCVWVYLLCGGVKSRFSDVTCRDANHVHIKAAVVLMILSQVCSLVIHLSHRYVFG